MNTWYDQILLVKIGKYIGFCVYRRSYLLWSPVIAVKELCSVLVRYFPQAVGVV